jgi:hypothetical protein
VDGVDGVEGLMMIYDGKGGREIGFRFSSSARCLGLLFFCWRRAGRQVFVCCIDM